MKKKVKENLCNLRNVALEAEMEIEQIKMEAKAYGLEWEVRTWAEKLINENPTISWVEAYREAALEWDL